MGKNFDYDYIIIGSGPAGTTAALNLAKTKRKKIAIIEGANYGGNNLNTRDIPYTISLEFAHKFYDLKDSPELTGQNLHYNFPTIVAHQEKVAKALGAGDKKLFRAAGITCIDGYAHFLDANTIAVGNKKITSSYFVLATGAVLDTGKIVGLNSVDYYTPNDIIKIRRLPKFVLVVGGGSTGCEVAEYFAKLGTKVILMESESRILPKEDAEASICLRDYFKKELGIMVMESCKVVEVSKDGAAKRVIFTTNGAEKMVRIDCVVLATGAKPRTDYGLENAGVKFTKTGITVDKFFQTSARNIFAIGDCIGSNSSTERAEYEASVLADNLLHRTKNPVRHSGFIRVTGTSPEIATVGKTEATLIKNKVKYEKSVALLKDIPASKIFGISHGFVKILVDRSGRIIGATIMAPGASLMITELAIAIRHHLTAVEVAGTPHVTNGFGQAVKLAAKKLVK